MLSQRVGAPSFSLLHRIPLCKCTIVFGSTHTDGHLGCFQYLAIVNCAAVNNRVHRFFWIGVSGLLGYIPSSGIAGSVFQTDGFLHLGSHFPPFSAYF